MSSDSPSTRILENNSHMSVGMSPHRHFQGKHDGLSNFVATTVTPLQTSCNAMNDTAVDASSGEEYLHAMGWDLQFDQQQPVETICIQVSLNKRRLAFINSILLLTDTNHL